MVHRLENLCYYFLVFPPSVFTCVHLWFQSSHLKPSILKENSYFLPAENSGGFNTIVTFA